MKVFELKNGVIQKSFDSPSCHNAVIVDGGFASSEGGFWASIQAIGGYGIYGRIKDPEVYDSILEAYLSKEVVRICLL